MNVMHFGMLCQVKREKMGLNRVEAMGRIGVKNLGYIEKGKINPMPKTKQKLISFYQINSDELSLLKEEPATQKREVKFNRVDKISGLIDELIGLVSKMDIPGLMANSIKSTSLEQLNIAKEAIGDLVILDRLL